MEDINLQCIKYVTYVGDRQLHLKDVNGDSIRPGDIVKTKQKPGGVLPPGKPFIGIAVCVKDAFGIPTIGLKDDKGQVQRLIYGCINRIIR